MTREFATALASEVTRTLSVKADVVPRADLACHVELTLDGERVVLRDAEDWVFLLAEQRSLGTAA